MLEYRQSVVKEDIVMEDPRIKKLAQFMVNYSIAVQPEQKVVIEGGVSATPPRSATNE